MEQKNFSFDVLEVPVARERIGELSALWDSIFGKDFTLSQNLLSILTGQEKEFNRDFIFVAKYKNSVVSTAHLTVSIFDKRFGGVGEVATHPDYRGKGLARILCSRVIEEFEKIGGKYLFLGTGNFIAAKLYHSLGWRYILGSKVMLRNSEGESPESFFAEYFCNVKNSKVQVVKGDARFRLQIIPCILFPYDEIVLDLNTELFSTRWFIQNSCMGLYPRYEKIDKNGSWFVALKGKTVAGISSVRFFDGYCAQVDVFCLPEVSKGDMENLFMKSIEYAWEKGIKEISFASDTLNNRKKELFLKIGCIEQKKTIELEKFFPVDIIVFKLFKK